MATFEEIQAEYERRKSAKAGQPNWLQRNILPDDDPTSHNAGEKAAAMLNKAGEAMTFGLVGDEADARVKSWLPGGGTYDQELTKNRLQEDVLRDDNPGLHMASELGGAVAGAMLPVGAIGTLGRGAGWAQKGIASAVAGSGQGATYGFMEGEGVEDRKDRSQWGAKIGLGVGLLAPIAGAGVQRASDSKAARDFLAKVGREAPSSAAMKAQAQGLYQQVDDAGVQIRPERFTGLMDDIKSHLDGQGLDNLPGPSSLTPKTARVMQKADEMSGQMAQAADDGLNPGLPFSSLDQLRRHAGNAAGDKSPNAATDRMLGTMTIEKLDDFVNRLGPDDVVGGDLAALQTALPKAREMWGRMRRTEMVEDAMDNAETYLSGPVSGLRNQIGSLLRNKRTRDSFTGAERAALKRVSQGTGIERLVINLGGGMNQIMSSGLGGAMGAGLGSTMGPVGSVAGALAGGALGSGVARTAGRVSENIVRKNAEIARGLIAKGGVKSLPVATSANRQAVEAMLRRAGATGPQ